MVTRLINIGKKYIFHVIYMMISEFYKDKIAKVSRK